MERARRLTLAALAALLPALAPGARAGELSGALVVFPSPLEARFKDDYGVDEEGVLRAAIASALSRALAPVALKQPLGAHITVEDVAPTRPTRAQLDANLSLDQLRSKSLGGAALTAQLRDAQGQLVTTVSYRYFAPTITTGSPAQDPWADARLAIEGFAKRLAAAVSAARQAP
jgi:hypothetical protein